MSFLTSEDFLGLLSDYLDYQTWREFIFCDSNTLAIFGTDKFRKRAQIVRRRSFTTWLTNFLSNDNLSTVSIHTDSWTEAQYILGQSAKCQILYVCSRPMIDREAYVYWEATYYLRQISHYPYSTEKLGQIIENDRCKVVALLFDRCRMTISDFLNQLPTSSPAIISLSADAEERQRCEYSLPEGYVHSLTVYPESHGCKHVLYQVNLDRLYRFY